MKDLFTRDRYTEADALEIVTNQLEESVSLDFKAGQALQKKDKNKDEIAKDVSAFANSAGGLIIYGITETNHRASGFEPVDGNDITKEWIEQIINTRIQRRIEGLMIYPIRLESKIEKIVYVVQIPESFNAPHLSSDNRFYKRYNFFSVPMEEYEIRHLYNRKGQTQLKICEPIIQPRSSGASAQMVNWVDFSILFQIENIGKTIENQYKLEIQIPEFVYSAYSRQANPISKCLMRSNDKYSIFSVPNQSPIYQDEVTTVVEAMIKVDRGGFQHLINLPVYTKLRFSNGTVTRDFELDKLLQFHGASLTLDRFGR